MGGNLQSNRVLSGPYAGFTKQEMLTEWERYKAELVKSGSRLMGASVNGQSYQFGPRADMNLSTWGRAVRRALSQVDPTWIGPQTSIAIRFGNGYSFEGEGGVAPLGY